MKEGLKGYLYSLATDKACGLTASIFKGLLYLLSLLYEAGVKVILACYRLGILKAHRLGASVISVGNMTLGGTGKTPVVEAVAGILREAKKDMAILSRGYGGKLRAASCELERSQARAEQSGASPEGKPPRRGRVAKIGENPAAVEEVGDEPLLLSIHLPEVPILVGSDRVKNGQEAIAKYGVNTILLDDGFQHWRLKRELDIVVVDSTNPFGNGRCLPRGILREPISSLKRADVVVLTKTDAENQKSDVRCQMSANEKDNNLVCKFKIEDLKLILKKINPGVLIVESIHQPKHFRDTGSQKILDLSCISGKKVCCLSGIGDPAYFERIISGLGGEVHLKFQFPDHHRYSSRDLEEIYGACRKDGLDTVVTTEKDAVRIEPLMGDGGRFFGLKVLVLVVRIKITKNQERFAQRLLGL